MLHSLRKASAFLGLDVAPVSHTEKIVSACGGFLGILFVYLVSREFLSGESSALIVASMGASAVLLFAVPHGQLSQPWAVIGGHLISALIGVTCAKMLHDPVVAASAAVALAIGAMYYLRCLHPPGGATALTAVIGGSEVHALGYEFVLAPVMFNVLVILVCAIVINYFFAWRRYPAHLATRAHAHTPEDDTETGDIRHADLAYALRKLDSFVDVTEEDLAEIFALASEHAHQKSHMQTGQIERGRAYSNGRYADDWSVRQIVDESRDPRPEKDVVIYKVVAGKGRRGSGMCTRDEFARWARYEVIRNENSWQRVDHGHEQTGMLSSSAATRPLPAAMQPAD